MDVNTVPVASGARQVVGRCLLNGVEVPFFSLEVNTNAYYQADTFSVMFATSALPAENNMKWFSQQKAIEVELLVGIVGATGTNWLQLIVGRVDSVQYEPARFGVVLEGRDLTSHFIDNKTSEKYQNLTASQIAIKLAKKYGLKPMVTKTTRRVGSYYQIDHVDVRSERSEWDLLTYLAGIEGFQVYVRGRELHFEPSAWNAPPTKGANLEKQLAEVNAAIDAEAAKAEALNNQSIDLVNKAQAARAAGDEAGASAYYAQAKTVNEKSGAIIAAAKSNLVPTREKLKQQIAHPEPAGDAYVIRWVPPGSTTAHPQLNTSDDLRFERSLTLAPGVTVEIRTWNNKQKKAFTVSYPQNTAKGTAPGQSSPKRQVYSKTIAGLTRDEAMRRAQAWHRQITQHEMRVSGSMPGDNILMPDMPIRIEGTGSDFDQRYYSDSIRRSLSFQDGYRMSLTAKNSNPNSDPLV